MKKMIAALFLLILNSAAHADVREDFANADCGFLDVAYDLRGKGLLKSEVEVFLEGFDFALDFARGIADMSGMNAYREICDGNQNLTVSQAFQQVIERSSQANN